MSAPISNRAITTLVLILLMVMITMLGMAYNVKTVSLANDIQEIKKEIKVLKEYNARLLESDLQKNTLENIEHIASETLGMIPGKKIIYFTNEASPKPKPVIPPQAEIQPEAQ